RGTSRTDRQTGRRHASPAPHCRYCPTTFSRPERSARYTKGRSSKRRPWPPTSISRSCRSLRRSFTAYTTAGRSACEESENGGLRRVRRPVGPGNIAAAERLQGHRVGLDEFDTGAIADLAVDRFADAPSDHALQLHFALRVGER